MWQVINSIIMMIGVFVFGRIVLNKSIEVNKKVLVFIILVVSILHALISFNLEDTLKTLFMSLVNVLFFKYIFKESIQKSIFLTFLYMTILIILDLLVTLFSSKILGISREFLYNSYAGSILGNLSICILIVILTYFSRNVLRKIINTKIENNTKIIIFSLLTLLCSLMFFYTIIREFRYSDNIILYLISIIVLLSVLFSLMRQTMKYDNLLEFMVTYENEIEKQRTLRHETKNDFMTIRAKICDKQKEQEILDYIDDVINEKIMVKQEIYAKFGYLPPNGIKGLCYLKVQEAEKKGIKIALNISKKVKDSSIYHLSTRQQKEFGRILGVFLDNAIEASLESEEKQLGIEAYVNKDKEFKMIISNTYNNQIDKKKIGKESFSTKGKNRGHGLLLVKQIIGYSKIFEIKTDIQNKLYVQTIIVKDPN